MRFRKLVTLRNNNLCSGRALSLYAALDRTGFGSHFWVLIRDLSWLGVSQLGIEHDQTSIGTVSWLKNLLWKPPFGGPPNLETP